MYTNWKKMNNACKVAMVLMAMSSAAAGTGVEAANLVATVPSDYGSSQAGAITGSRMTSHVDKTVVKNKMGSLNQDPAFFPVWINGESKLFLRQYTYSTVDLRGSQLVDAQGDWKDPNRPQGTIKAVANAHAAAGHGDYLYATGYDLGQIGIAKIENETIHDLGVNADGSTNPHYVVKLKEDLNSDKVKAGYGEKVSVHGEGLLIQGDNLYVQTNINLTGGYMDYDNGYLLQYKINDDGSLTLRSYTRMGKNTDVPKMNLYNDKILISAIGGYQNYGSGNPETSIDVATIQTDGSLTPTGTQKIVKPSSVAATGHDFRGLQVLPNGTAYVMTYNIGAGGYGIGGEVYKTTISNLLSDAPEDWDLVLSGGNSGWFGKIEAESQTHRLWVELGDYIYMLPEGATIKDADFEKKSDEELAALGILRWKASDFSTSGYPNFNSVNMITNDIVWGQAATLTPATTEGLTRQSSYVQAVPNSNAEVAVTDYSSKITGTDEDIDYDNASSDYKNYTFTADTVIGVDETFYDGGDLTTNVLAAIDAHNGNSVTVNAGTNTLQLQAGHNIGNPAGIYAGNGRDVTVNAGKLNIITSNYEGGNSLTNAIWNDAGERAGSHITINAPVHISMTGGNGGNGIAIQKTDRVGESSYAANVASSITIKGDVSIKGADSNTWGIPINRDNVYSRFNNAGILTSVNNSWIRVRGSVDLAVYGNGITANAAGSEIHVLGGRIVVPKGTNYGYYAIAAYQGTVYFNSHKPGESYAVPHVVQLDGDIFATTTPIYDVVGNQTGTATGVVNLGLDRAESYFHGIVDNSGEVNMSLANGAVWINEANNTRYKTDDEDIGSNGASHINTFIGGTTIMSTGVIEQKSDKAITIDHYSGNTTVKYSTLEKSGDGVVIGGAAAGSSITMSADRSAVKTDENAALDALAGKLTYGNYTQGERNLSGTVSIAEGLTARSASKSGIISFDASTGKGYLSVEAAPAAYAAFAPMRLNAAAPASVSLSSAAAPAADSPKVVYGPEETGMMRGAKSAMTTSLLSWRSSMTDMNERLGDLRFGAESGIWARTYGGKAKYDKGNAYSEQNFWGAQVGADHKLASGWHIGGALDYNDGNADYAYGGEGDPKLYTLSVYGTKVFDDGQYIDIVAKAGKVKNKYTIYNAAGNHLKGDYDANGYGISAEYGKRFGRGSGYIEPQIQLSWSRLGSDDYDAMSDMEGGKAMHISQDGLTSFVGRIGIAAGKATERGNVYLKASVLHEFDGDASATFSADGERTATVKQDFGDTWAELTLGGNWRLGSSSVLYADLTKSFGGDYEMEWKANAGLRFSF